MECSRLQILAQWCSSLEGSGSAQALVNLEQRARDVASQERAILDPLRNLRDHLAKACVIVQFIIAQFWAKQIDVRKRVQNSEDEARLTRKGALTNSPLIVTSNLTASTIAGEGSCPNTLRSSLMRYIHLWSVDQRRFSTSKFWQDLQARQTCVRSTTAESMASVESLSSALQNAIIVSYDWLMGLEVLVSLVHGSLCKVAGQCDSSRSSFHR